MIAISFDQSEPEVRGTPGLGRRARRSGRALPARGGEGVPVKTSPPGFGVFVPCDKIPESLGGPPSG